MANKTIVMVRRHYPPDMTPVGDEPLSDKAVTAIGRIVRAAAEFEHCVTCFIVMLAGTSETKAHIFLGKMQLFGRLDVAKHLASIRKDDALKAYQFIANESVREAIRCRNAVCHGAYIGKADSGEYIFLTDNKALDDDNTFGATVVGYKEDALISCANMLEDVIPESEKHFQIESLRGKYLRQALRPHHKGRKQKSRAKGRKPPPEPSQA